MDPQRRGEIAWALLKYFFYRCEIEIALESEEDAVERRVGREVGNIARAIDVSPSELGAFLKQLFASLPRSVFCS